MKISEQNYSIVNNWGGTTGARSRIIYAKWSWRSREKKSLLRASSCTSNLDISMFLPMLFFCLQGLCLFLSILAVKGLAFYLLTLRFSCPCSTVDHMFNSSSYKIKSISGCVQKPLLPTASLPTLWLFLMVYGLLFCHTLEKTETLDHFSWQCSKIWGSIREIWDSIGTEASGPRRSSCQL